MSLMKVLYRDVKEQDEGKAARSGEVGPGGSCGESSPVREGWGQALNFTLLSHLEHGSMTKEVQRKALSTLVCCLFLPAPSAKSWVCLGYYRALDTLQGSVTGKMLNIYLLNKLLWLKPV